MNNSSPTLADDFTGLHNVLLAVVDPLGVHPFVLKEQLEENAIHLKKLLDIPPKNDASRAKVKSGMQLK
jgi:hypothetical protein